MKINLGKEIRRILGMSSTKKQRNVEPRECPEIIEIQNRIDQALAAYAIEDMEFPPSNRLRMICKNHFELELKLKWTGMIPTSLRIRLINDQLWDIEVVERTNEKS